MEVVLYGDSTLKRLSKDILSSLENKIPGLTLHNYSTGGFNTQDALLRASFVANLPADLFILCFGLNDSAPWKRIEKNEFVFNLRQIIKTLGPGRVLFIAPPLINEAMQSGESIRNNIDLTEYMKLAQGLFDELRTPFIGQEWCQGPEDNIYAEDGVHLNDNGNKILINTIAKALSS